MKLILFTKTIRHDASRRMISALYQMNLHFQVITGSSLLQDLMLRMHTDEALFIFLLLDEKDMEFLHTMQSQIRNCKIITILPNDSEQSHTIGRSLLPRFQALLSDDLSVVAEVAARIINKDSYDCRITKTEKTIKNHESRE